MRLYSAFGTDFRVSGHSLPQASLEHRWVKPLRVFALPVSLWRVSSAVWLLPAFLGQFAAGQPVVAFAVCILRPLPTGRCAC